MKSNKNMLKISNTSKLNPKFRRNNKNKTLKIRCNLETKSSYNKAKRQSPISKCSPLCVECSL